MLKLLFFKYSLYLNSKQSQSAFKSVEYSTQRHKDNILSILLPSREPLGVVRAWKEY